MGDGQKFSREMTNSQGLFSLFSSFFTLYALIYFISFVTKYVAKKLILKN